jgi:hypothetical protein
VPERRGKRVECAHDILWRAAAKRADDYSTRVSERKSRLVEIVLVACDEYTLKAQRFRHMVLVWTAFDLPAFQRHRRKDAAHTYKAC